MNVAKIVAAAKVADQLNSGTGVVVVDVVVQLEVVVVSTRCRADIELGSAALAAPIVADFEGAGSVALTKVGTLLETPACAAEASIDRTSNPTVSMCTGMMNVVVCPAASVAIVNFVGATAVIESGRNKVTLVSLTGVASPLVTLAVRSNSW